MAAAKPIITKYRVANGRLHELKLHERKDGYQAADPALKGQVHDACGWRTIIPRRMVFDTPLDAFKEALQREREARTEAWT